MVDIDIVVVVVHAIQEENGHKHVWCLCLYTLRAKSTNDCLLLSVSFCSCTCVAYTFRIRWLWHYFPSKSNNKNKNNAKLHTHNLWFFFFSFLPFFHATSFSGHQHHQWQHQQQQQQRPAKANVCIYTITTNKTSRETMQARRKKKKWFDEMNQTLQNLCLNIFFFSSFWQHGDFEVQNGMERKWPKRQQQQTHKSQRIHQITKEKLFGRQWCVAAYKVVYKIFFCLGQREYWDARATKKCTRLTLQTFFSFSVLPFRVFGSVASLIFRLLWLRRWWRCISSDWRA